MDIAKVIARILVCGLILAVLVVAPASAHELVASKAGALNIKQLSVSKFETSGGVFECKKQTAEGSVVAGSQKTVIVKIQFKECTAFGFALEASLAEFELSAEGTATVKKAVTMLMPLAECTITLPTSGNSNLKSVTYKNLTGGKLEIKMSLEKMIYEASGGTCGESGTNGRYNGRSEVELPGGTLEWK